MTQTLIVYSIIFIVFFISAYVSSRKNKFSYILMGFFVYSIFMGVRYGVGRDYFAYKNIFELYNNTGEFIYDRLGLMFKFLISGVSFFCGSYSVFLGVVAFFQIFLIFKSFQSSIFIYPYLVFTYMIGCEWLGYANGLRQILAFCFFVYSIQYIPCKKKSRYFLCLIVAVLCHKSALILIPSYWIFTYKKEWFVSVKKQLTLLIFSLVLMKIDIVLDFVSLVEPFVVFLGYEQYINESSNHLHREVDVGIGFYVLLLINIILIVNSKKVKLFFRNEVLTIIYNFYFFGVLWSYVFVNSLILNRINYYTYGFQYIVAAFTLYYFYYNRNRKMFSILGLLFILIFIATMYRMSTNTSMYIFNWQKDLFYLKRYFMV